MARITIPPLQDLASLRTPLTSGETRVLDFFNRNLPSAWEIYIQPHLNGLRPDFVLLNPNVGIAVFEVKDWDLSAMEYELRPRPGIDPVLYACSPHERWFRVKENPIDKCQLYKEGLLELYCPRLGIKLSDDSRIKAVVTTGVIMTQATTAEARRLFDPLRQALGHLNDQATPYYPLVGRDALDQNDLATVFPASQWHRSNYMTERLAQDLRTWLWEPDHATVQREPLELDEFQRTQAIKPPPEKTGCRRMRGPAGSGKSLVLAARAAHLAAEGRDVLVVTYNITLWHYLRDLAVRYRHPLLGKHDKTKIVWCHFHEWCKRVCYEAGMGAEYRALWHGRNNDLDDDEGLDALVIGDEQGQEPVAYQNQDDKEALLSAILETRLPALTKAAIARGVTDYDAILVDEGQDFNLDWWNVLRESRRADGEMLLAADQNQDLYGRSKRWTDAQMRGAGFVGRWVELKVSYRTPPAFIPYLQQFVSAYLDDPSITPPASHQSPELDLYPIEIQWIQVPSEHDIAQVCVDAALDMPMFAEPDQIAFSDVTMIVGSNKCGLHCVKLLGEKVGVAHTFGETRRKQRLRKRAFFMGDGRIKATTIKSFKGWEARSLVVHIGWANNQESLAAAYVALSRLKRHHRGSYLTVVCSAPQLEEYGRTWPNFDKLDAAVVHTTPPGTVIKRPIQGENIARAEAIAHLTLSKEARRSY